MGFKKSGGFKGGDRKRDGGGFNRGGDRSSFGNKPFHGGGNDRRPMQMFSATCAECGKVAEVPFRPTGDKPVYCRECFAAKRNSAPTNRDGGRDFPKREFVTAPSVGQQGTADHRVDELKRVMDVVTSKLDTLMKMVEGMNAKPAPKAKPEVSLTQVVKKAAKTKTPKAKK